MRRPISTALALVGVGIVAASLSAAILALSMARIVVTPPRRAFTNVSVLDVNTTAGTVTLSRTADTVVPGQYSLWFDRDHGHARVGAIITESPRSVTRELHSVHRGDISRATRGRWAGEWYLTPADLGLDYREVEIRTAVGPAPAWLVDPVVAHGDWVIQVHGRAGTRAEGLRAIPVFRAAGYRCLLISYRNDGDAPPSLDGRYALGDGEWRDVEAAISFAREQGARHVVLMGWSMGGAMAVQCLTRSSLAQYVTGVVLESPVVDWVRVLRFQATAARLPGRVGETAIGMLASQRAARWVGHDAPIDFERLDLVARAAELTVPMLVLHSIDDALVPSDGSVTLAAARPDLVRLELFAVARHTKLWNYDAERWKRAISTWLAEREPVTAPQG